MLPSSSTSVRPTQTDRHTDHATYDICSNRSKTTCKQKVFVADPTQVDRVVNLAGLYDELIAEPTHGGRTTAEIPTTRSNLTHLDVSIKWLLDVYNHITQLLRSLSSTTKSVSPITITTTFYRIWRTRCSRRWQTSPPVPPPSQTQPNNVVQCPTCAVTRRTGWNMRVIFVSGLFTPLCENMTSSIKLKVLNVSHCHQRRNKPWPQLTCVRNFLKVGCVVLDIREQTDRQYDRHKYRHADCNILHPYWGGE